MSRTKFYTYFLIVIALAVFVRGYNLELSSLWTDELATYWVSTAATFEDCIQRAAITQGQSPFYFILEKLILMALPHSEWSIRLLSFAASVASVIVIYYVALLTFKRKMAGLGAALAFALNIHQIYYAQEARPYALALLLALLSQFFFLKLLRHRTVPLMSGYLFFSITACYCHYFMGPLLVVQTIYVGYLFFRGKIDLTFIKSWLILQFLIGLSFIGLLFQLKPMFTNRSKWGWLSQLTFGESFRLFIEMLDGKILIALLLIGLLGAFFEKLNLKKVCYANRDALFLLFTWWLFPFIFCYTITAFLKVPLISERYLALSLIPGSLFIGKLLTMHRFLPIKRIMIIGFFGLYLWFVLLPPLKSEGMLCYRISHDWRLALTFIEANYQPGDAILCRTGYVKENWLPTDQRPLVHNYAKSPFYSIYWHQQQPVDKQPIHNLTYTYEEEFAPYYTTLLQQKLRHAKRIWIIGVDPPNTNFPINRVPLLTATRLHTKLVAERDFSGVYVALTVPTKK